MNRRTTRPTIPHPHFHKYLKPGALARIRDSRISARTHRLNSLSLSQIPIHRPSPPSSPPQSNTADDIPFFANIFYGPRCLQRKKLMAAKSIFSLPPNPAADSPDLITDSFAGDILVAN